MASAVDPAQPTRLTFFASSASSFCPTPYAPGSSTAGASSSSSASGPTFSTRNTNNRSHDALPQSMDPLPTDPNVLFVHPPFDTFPNSHLHPDGLTYNVMAENPEWFLDANDFVSQNKSVTNAVAYPPHLEPPRGWCPAKKKDMKERGNEGWPEGEEPRLRCTFCRRTYAGVNAKSMWRRHVFEKHKIAMANRRDGAMDRPRGRGSGKENKQVTAVKKSESHDGLISIIVAPQTIPDVASHKSRFRTMKDGENAKKRERKVRQNSHPLTPHQPKIAYPVPDEEEEESDEERERLPKHTTTTPPLTPHAEESSDPPTVLTSESRASASPPPIPRPLIPESPYNPLQTPSFRHSPARLPSDQPWRFPSPSHPLHSTTRDLSLTVLVKSDSTPSIKGLPPIGASPMLALHSSPLTGPLGSDSSNLETPARTTRFLFGKPGAKAYLFDHIGSPLGLGRSRLSRPRITSSPFPLSTRRTPKGHSRNPSGSSDAWFGTDERLSSSASLPGEPSSSDPFSIWPSINGSSIVSPVRLPRPPVEVESPVVRSGSAPSLGGGLLEPFSLRKPEERDDDVDDDLKGLLSSSPIRGDPKTEGKRSITPETDPTGSSPPPKRRRMSIQ